MKATLSTNRHSDCEQGPVVLTALFLQVDDVLLMHMHRYQAAIAASAGIPVTQVTVSVVSGSRRHLMSGGLTLDTIVRHQSLI